MRSEISNIDAFDIKEVLPDIYIETHKNSYVVHQLMYSTWQQFLWRLNSYNYIFLHYHFLSVHIPASDDRCVYVEFKFFTNM